MRLFVIFGRPHGQMRPAVLWLFVHLIVVIIVVVARCCFPDQPEPTDPRLRLRGGAALEADRLAGACDFEQIPICKLNLLRGGIGPFCIANSLVNNRVRIRANRSIAQIGHLVAGAREPVEFYYSERLQLIN